MMVAVLAVAELLNVRVPRLLLVIVELPADVASKKSVCTLLVMFALPAVLVSKNCRMLSLTMVAVAPVLVFWNTRKPPLKLLIVTGPVPPLAELAFWNTIELPDAGDFEKDRGFSYGAWVRIPRRGTTGAVVARMDDKNDYRGWDLWIEGDRIGTHIVNKWPEDALKVTGQTQLQPNQWYHVFVTYDGSGSAAGVRLYVNGNPEPMNVFTDALKSTIRTKVPLKVAQRHGTSRIDNLRVQDVRLYGRALSGLEVGRVAKTTRAASESV